MDSAPDLAAWICGIILVSAVRIAVTVFVLSVGGFAVGGVVWGLGFVVAVAYDLFGCVRFAGKFLRVSSAAGFGLGLGNAEHPR